MMIDGVLGYGSRWKTPHKETKSKGTFHKFGPKSGGRWRKLFTGVAEETAEGCSIGSAFIITTIIIIITTITIIITLTITITIIIIVIIIIIIIIIISIIIITLIIMLCNMCDVENTEVAEGVGSFSVMWRK
jgi:ABC-type multidrug transport system fused ATPase/permease subunit